MTRRIFLCFAAVFFLLVTTANSLIITNDSYNFSFDVPEGYKLESKSDDNLSFSFNHPNIPVFFLLKIYDGKEFKNCQSTLKNSIEKIQPKADIETFKWNDSNCAISTLSFSIDKNYSGWAVCTPLQKKNAYLVMLCYCPEDEADSCNQFIISTMNSLCTDTKYYCYPGVIMSFAFPPEGKKDVDFTLYGKKIKTTLDKSDEEAAQYLVDLEFSVLSLYIQHNSWKEAWQRYYRIIFRDSWGRMEDCMEKVLSTFIPYAEKINPENPELQLSQMILTWTQKMPYKTKQPDIKDSDFTCLPSMICGVENDCDSRALFVCMFLRTVGIDCFMLISPEYSHAMIALGIDAPGQKYKPEGSDKEYLMGETTAEVTWGTIAQNMADRSKWFPSYLP